MVYGMLFSDWCSYVCSADLQVAMAMIVQGAALVGMGYYAKAEPLLLESLEHLADAPIPGLSAVGRSRLAGLYRAWGKPEQARKFQAVQGAGAVAAAPPA